MAIAYDNIRHIKLLNVPIEKIKYDIEQYSLNLTNYYPDMVELTELSQNNASWLLTFPSDIGLFFVIFKK